MSYCPFVGFVRSELGFRTDHDLRKFSFSPLSPHFSAMSRLLFGRGKHHCALYDPKYSPDS